MKKRNVIWLTVAQCILVIVAYFIVATMSAGFNGACTMIVNMIDIPSLIFILIFSLPCLAIAGAWKDFWRAFTVGKKEYSLKELKNMSEAVKVGQKLPILGGIFAVMISLIAVFHYVDVASYGVELFIANLSVAILPVIYVTIIEFLLLPVSVNLTKTINEVMSFDEEE